jgi:hypothetical protein
MSKSNSIMCFLNYIFHSIGYLFKSSKKISKIQRQRKVFQQSPSISVRYDYSRKWLIPLLIFFAKTLSKQNWINKSNDTHACIHFEINLALTIKNISYDQIVYCVISINSDTFFDEQFVCIAQVCKSKKSHF